MFIESKILKAVANSASSDLSRAVINTVKVEKDNNYINVVATNSYVLAWVRIPVEFCGNTDGFTDCLIPTNQVKMLTSGKAKFISFEEDSIVSYDSISFDTKLCECAYVTDFGNYPPWQQLVKQTQDGKINQISFNSDYIMNGCKTVKAIFGKDATIQLEATSSGKPAYITCCKEDKQLVYLIMPVRTDDKLNRETHHLYY